MKKIIAISLLITNLFSISLKDVGLLETEEVKNNVEYNTIEIKSLNKIEYFSKRLENKINEMFFQYRIIKKDDEYKVLIGNYETYLALNNDLEKIKTQITRIAIPRQIDFSKYKIYKTNTVEEREINSLKPKVKMVENRDTINYDKEIETFIMLEIGKKNQRLKKFENLINKEENKKK